MIKALLTALTFLVAVSASGQDPVNAVDSLISGASGPAEDTHPVTQHETQEELIFTREKPRVYPNPFRSTVTIDKTDDLKSISFVNLIGRTVREEKLDGGGSISIVTDDLDDGIYMVVLLKNDGKRKIYKMIKH